MEKIIKPITTLYSEDAAPRGPLEWGQWLEIKIETLQMLLNYNEMPTFRPCTGHHQGTQMSYQI